MKPIDKRYDRMLDYGPVPGDPGAPFKKHPDELPFVLTSLEDWEGKRVLDIGANTGFFSHCLVERGASVTSVEISDVIRRKGQEAVPGARWVKEIPMEEEFDFVLMLNVFHHIRRQIGQGKSNELLYSLLKRSPLVCVNFIGRHEDAPVRVGASVVKKEAIVWRYGRSKSMRTAFLLSGCTEKPAEVFGKPAFASSIAFKASALEKEGWVRVRSRNVLARDQVFTKKDEDSIWKLCWATRKNAKNRYICYAREIQNLSNPWLPRIWAIEDFEDGTAIRIERLEHAAGAREVARRLDKMVNTGDLSGEPELDAAVELIRRVIRETRGKNDLRNWSNVMKRADGQYVITDPLV